MDYEKYLREHNFQKHYNKLVKKFKKQRILIYGAGELFCYIRNNYDLSQLNIIGITDKKFKNEEEGNLFLGYKIIPLNSIKKYNPDYILVSVLKFYNLIQQIQTDKQNPLNKFNKFIPIIGLTIQEIFSTVLQEIKYQNILIKLLTITYYMFPNKGIINYKNKINNFLYQKKHNKIKKNYLNKIEKIKKKLNKKEKIRVIFHVFDDARWKYQSLYELLDKQKNFEPIIVLSRLYVQKDNTTRIQSIEELEHTYNFFKNKGMNIELGYNTKTNTYIPLEKFKPDYIFYQLPFYCHPQHQPEHCSKFALTAYIPYCTSLSLTETTNELEFRNCLFRYYLTDNYLKEYYSELMNNNGKNIRVTGHTQFDYYFINKDKFNDKDKTYVIYTPHHSIEKNSPIKLSTFLETGFFMLQYAQKHPEINWVFRPHPLLKNVLKTIYDDKTIEQYYNSWKEIGIYDTDGNYLDLFIKSKLLINDSGFVYEYFPTKQPIIQLINPNAAIYDKTTEEIIQQACYKVYNNDELEKYLDLILIKNQDPLKEKRLQLYKELNLENNYAAQNILNDIKTTLEFD